MDTGRLLAPLALLLAAVAAPALADEAAGGGLPCTRQDNLSTFLARTYGETPVSAGLQGDGRLLQIFASAESGSWTAVSTDPAGLACVVATGRDWEQRPDGSGAERVYDPAAYRP